MQSLALRCCVCVVTAAAHTVQTENEHGFVKVKSRRRQTRKTVVVLFLCVFLDTAGL